MTQYFLKLRPESESCQSEGQREEQNPCIEETETGYQLFQILPCLTQDLKL